MPNCCDAKLLEGLMRQARKNRLVYLVLAEGGLVAFETQAPQPPTEVHDSALIQPKAHDPPDETRCLGRSLTAPQQLRQLGDVGAFRRLRPGGQEKEPEALYALRAPELCLNLGLSSGRLVDVGGHGEPPRYLINGKCSRALKGSKAIHPVWLMGESIAVEAPSADPPISERSARAPPTAAHPVAREQLRCRQK